MSSLFAASVLLGVVAHAPVSLPADRSAVCFVRNAGQWATGARYVLRADGLDLWLTSRGARLDHYQPVWETSSQPSATLEPERRLAGRRGHVIDVEFVNAAPATFEEGPALGGTLNYFVGNVPSRWATGLPRLATVRQADLYPGIDAVWSRSDAGPRFDFVVRPGGDPSAIKLRLQGTQAQADGASLTYGTSLGSQSLTRLYAFQQVAGQTRHVPARFVACGGSTFGVELGAYDRTKPLVIDPLVAASYIGGAPTDHPYWVTHDDYGEVIVSGVATNAEFPVSLGSYDLSYNGGGDMFIAKFDPDLTQMRWGTYLGGSASEGYSEYDLRVRYARGNIYAYGATGSADFPMVGSPFDSTYNGAHDGFVAILDAGGSSLLASTFYGGSSTDSVYGLLVHSTGSVVVGVRTYSDNLPITSNALDNTRSEYEMAMATFSSNLSSMVYGTFFGGTGSDNLLDMHWRGNQVVLCGQTLSTDYRVTTNALDTTLGGLRDAVVTVLSPTSPTLYYSTYLGGSLADGLLSSTMGPDGNLWAAGWTVSTDFPTTPGVYATTGDGATDSWVAKLRLDGGGLVAATYTRTQLDGWSMNLDPGGSPIVSGSTAGVAVTTPGAYRTTTGSGVIFRLTPDLRRYAYGTLLEVPARFGKLSTRDNTLAVVGVGVGPTTPGTWLNQAEGAWIGRFVLQAQPRAVALINNGATKSTHYWTTDGKGAITNWRNSGTIPTGWVFVGHGDMSGDEYDDLIVMRTSDQTLGAYLLTSTGAVSTWLGMGRVATGWRVAAVGDWNGDGYTDLVLERNDGTARGVWLMRDGKVTGWLSLYLDGVISAAEDLDANGYTDLLAASGDRIRVQMRAQGATYTGYIDPPAGLTLVDPFQADSDPQLELLMWDANARKLIAWNVFDDSGDLVDWTSVAASYTPIGTGRLF